jgi:Sulfotransferase domain
MRWNFSSRAQSLSQGDAIILSIPKSGRTWVRVFLSAYFSATADRLFAIDITERRGERIPRIIYTHDRFEQRTKASLWERVRGKYLVPRKQLNSAPVILLARDPRDAFASYHVQLKHRNHPAPESIKRLPASALLRHPRFGIGSMVEVMNEWMREFGGRANFGIVRYEDLRANPPVSFRKLLAALGVRAIDECALDQALRFSAFDNMQRLEASGAFGNKILAPRDAADPESFKVRRGKMGGFTEYLSCEEQKYAARMCERLNPVFGYKIRGSAVDE